MMCVHGVRSLEVKYITEVFVLQPMTLLSWNVLDHVTTSGPCKVWPAPQNLDCYSLVRAPEFSAVKCLLMHR
jgi:hypothetical protein